MDFALRCAFELEAREEAKAASRARVLPHRLPTMLIEILDDGTPDPGTAVFYDDCSMNILLHRRIPAQLMPCLLHEARACIADGTLGCICMPLNIRGADGTLHCNIISFLGHSIERFEPRGDITATHHSKALRGLYTADALDSYLAHVLCSWLCDPRAAHLASSVTGRRVFPLEHSQYFEPLPIGISSRDPAFANAAECSQLAFAYARLRMQAPQQSREAVHLSWLAAEQHAAGTSL